MGYDPQTCYNKLEEAGVSPPCGKVLSSLPHHCSEQQTGAPFHTFCSQNAIYTPFQAAYCKNTQTGEILNAAPDQVMMECMKLMQQPNSPWVFGNCWCCCSCFAYDTPIATPSGYVAIQTIPTGAKVMTATVTRTAGKVALSWHPIQVDFSSGAGGTTNRQPDMVYIVYGKGEARHELIVTRDQVFMLSDGSLTTAERLTLDDQLIDKDGAAVPIHRIAIGSYVGGVHHIGLKGDFDGNIDNHLLLAGGVVAGDYDLQLSFSTVDAANKCPRHDQRCRIGTDAYDQVHTGRADDVQLAFAHPVNKNLAGQSETASRFRVYSRRLSLSGGMMAGRSFFTEAQAEALLKEGTQAPGNLPVAAGLLEQCFRQLQGFYPDITFYFDEAILLPNAYAFEEYGKRFVVVTAGLGTQKGIGYEGLMAIVGHCLGCFYGSPPKVSSDYACVGSADAYAFAMVTRQAWYGPSWSSMSMLALTAMTNLFAKVPKGPAAGNPQDPLNDPSLDCRLEAMASATGGGNLPACAGGVPDPVIRLDQATPDASGNVALFFSVGLTPTTAETAANYTFTPDADTEPAIKVRSAKLDATRDFIVHLETDAQAGASQTLTVQNLTSIFNTGIDPQHDSLRVSFPAAQPATP